MTLTEVVYACLSVLAVAATSLLVLAALVVAYVPRQRGAEQVSEPTEPTDIERARRERRLESLALDRGALDREHFLLLVRIAVDALREAGDEDTARLLESEIEEIG